MKKRSLLFIFLFFSLSFTNIFAQDWATSVKVSTLGGNIEVYRSFGEQFNAHLGFNYFSLEQDVTGQEDFDSKFKVGLMSVSALGDYFPFEGGGFRLTAGLFVNLNQIDATLTPTDSYEVGGDVYTPEELGTLEANITFNKIAPYIGLGFGNPTGGESGLGFTFEIGTIYQGGSIVDLTATGLLEPSAAEDQEQTFEDNLAWFKWYPVVSLGLTYKF
jgi:hypothetical protein